MFRRLRAWWATQTHPYRSPAYDAAREVLGPGYLRRLADEEARVDERRRREAEWFDGLVAMQQDGRVDEAVARAEADHAARRLEFVYDLPCWLATLYDKEVDRLLPLGDVDGAVRAARAAISQMQVWASWSTSGGEGSARTYETGEMQKKLDAKLAPHNARV